MKTTPLQILFYVTLTYIFKVNMQSITKLSLQIYLSTWTTTAIDLLVFNRQWNVSVMQNTAIVTITSYCVH